MSGNVKAQYQFQSFDDTEPKSAAFDATTEFLSIDCQRLSESVRSLPLHQRLHIDLSLFDVNLSSFLLTMLMLIT